MDVDPPHCLASALLLRAPLRANHPVLYMSVQDAFATATAASAAASNLEINAELVRVLWGHVTLLMQQNETKAYDKRSSEYNEQLRRVRRSFSELEAAIPSRIDDYAVLSIVERVLVAVSASPKSARIASEYFIDTFLAWVYASYLQLPDDNVRELVGRVEMSTAPISDDDLVQFFHLGNAILWTLQHAQ
jgi:hypothetical protein